ncbi:MAG: glutamate racemase, partial [Actinomycetota bacterium]|nr:glutamate racemase [Actinomycetota bacterium]
SLARITPEMIAAAQRAATGPRISNFVGQGASAGPLSGGSLL